MYLYLYAYNTTWSQKFCYILVTLDNLAAIDAFVKVVKVIYYSEMLSLNGTHQICLHGLG